MKKFITILTFIVPGSGQLVNKDYKKAFIGLIYFILSCTVIQSVIIPNTKLLFVHHATGDYSGLVTIGATEYQDDSFLILVGAAFCFILLLILAFGALYFARNYYQVAVAKEKGVKLVGLKEQARAIAPDLIPHAVTVPYYILMFMFMVIPAIISIAIAFTNYQDPILPPAFLIQWVGFDNFKNLITDPKLLSAFTETLRWTLVWTFSASLINIGVGIFLAIVANNKRIKGKKFFRIVFLLPWAIPAFLTILVFQIFFSKVGAMNTFVIPLFTGQEYSVKTAIGFLIDPHLAKMTILFVQGWLGFPYMFILITGILQAIPGDLYEAANIDGGNPWTNFWDITFPAIFVAASPILITQFTTQFNNVTIFYLLGGSVVKPIGASYSPVETIASLGYQLTLNSEYATASVFALLTSIVVSSIVLFSWIKAGAFKNEEVY